MWELDLSFSPLLPVLEIIFVEVHQHRLVSIFKLLNLLFWDYYEDACHDSWAMHIDEKLIIHIFLVDNIWEVLLHEGFAIFFGQGCTFHLDLILLIKFFLKWIITSVKCLFNLGTDHSKWLVHLKSIWVPLELLDICLNGLANGSSSRLLNFNGQFWFIFHLFANVTIKFFVSLDTLVQL